MVEITAGLIVSERSQTQKLSGKAFLCCNTSFYSEMLAKNEAKVAKM